MFSQFSVPVVGVICRILQNVMESEISAKLQIPKGCTLQGQESVKAGNKKRYSRRVGIYKKIALISGYMTHRRTACN